MTTQHSSPESDTDLRLLVDIVWNHATESMAVPSTKTADMLIAKYRKCFGAPAQTLPTDLATITELRVFEHGGFRAIVDGVGGWGSTQLAAIQNATQNAKKLNSPALTSTQAPAQTTRDAVIEECAQIAEAQAQEFLSPGYASNQPYGSICERFACEEVANAIRALSVTQFHQLGRDLNAVHPRKHLDDLVDNPAVASTVQQPVENKKGGAVWPTGTGNTPQDVQLTSLVTRPDGGGK